MELLKSEKWEEIDKYLAQMHAVVISAALRGEDIPSFVSDILITMPSSRNQASYNYIKRKVKILLLGLACNKILEGR